MDVNHKESPEYLKMSMGAALTLGFKDGRFYRNARLRCINLLQVYSGGCSGRCAYCGLSEKRSTTLKEGSFIRVAWPVHSLEDILKKMKTYQYKFNRVCISMITRKKSSQDVAFIIKKTRAAIDTPISVLICPTVTTTSDLIRIKESGADKIGVALDGATVEVFDKYRGKGVGGPHQWETYWDIYQKALEIFGNKNAGVHLIVGLGETEKEMAETIQKAYNFGGSTHLFSFYPETGSQLESRQPPSIGQYRRIQLARYLIDEGIANVSNFAFNNLGKVVKYGVSSHKLNDIINSGLPLMTSGCTGSNGKVACNRPYANYPPPDIRNYPFDLNREDIAKAVKQLYCY